LRISFGYSEGSPAPAVLQDYDTADKSLWTAIWIGVQPNVPDVSQANLVQPLLNWCADQESCGCDGAATEWCVTASTYTPEGQTGNAYVAVPKDATLDFESEFHPKHWPVLQSCGLGDPRRLRRCY
jgi:hypothetical protein